MNYKENRICVIFSKTFLIFWMLTGTNGEVRHGSFLRVMTFNAGLTPRVHLYDDRKLHVGESIMDVQSDIVCLQEVWYSDDVRRIMDSTVQTYPYSYSAIHRAVGELPPSSHFDAPCFSAAFWQFLACITRHCHATNGTLEFLTCAKDTCGLMRLDQACITCLVITGTDDIASRCLGNFGTKFNVEGLMLISKYPLRNATSARFIPNQKLILPRGYLSVEVDGVGTVVCAHATANLGDSNYEALDYRTWAEQNMAEARMLVQHLQNKGNVIVMGDLNSSPSHEATSVVADMPGLYNTFKEAGYTSLYMDNVGICTYCVYNPLTDYAHNLVLDHVLVKNLTVLSARRVLDENLPQKGFPLSDHFGIEARIQIPPSDHVGIEARIQIPPSDHGGIVDMIRRALSDYFYESSVHELTPGI